jgi:Ion channel
MNDHTFSFYLLPFTFLGVALLLLVAYDIYATILHAPARFGPIGENLNRIVWRMMRALAFKLSRARRHRLLNTVGPLLLPSLIFIYIVLLVLGFALIYYPRMPEHFVVGPEAKTAAWSESLYFSGITLTTVGYGDIAPRTASMRLVSMFESASGFAVISLAITYLLTVYRALERKRATAISLYHQAEEGADVAGFLNHHFVDGRFYGLQDTMRSATRDIQSLLESHIEHPVIHYFHPVEVYKSLPRILFLLLETCAVIRSCLDDNEYSEMVNRPEIRTLEASARYVLGALFASLDLERRARIERETKAEELRRWRRRYQQTMRRLIESGIKTRPEEEAGWEGYQAQREEWESKLQHISHYLGYDWEEVTGDRDLRYAAEEQ